MTLWNDLGFRENPYATPPLPGTEEGSKLLVGRESSIQRLLRALTSLDTHPTVEGDNGVGKTSLVAVTSYRGKLAFESGDSPCLLLPLPKPFQLTIGYQSFDRQVLFSIAQAVIDYSSDLRRIRRELPDLDDVRRWIESPLLGGRSGRASFLGFGASGGFSTSPNTSPGYVEAGFRETIRTWLSQIFPTPTTGAFVGIIDNLELLETSTEARRRIEALRDSILNLPGMRWVLCGARGIVRSAASSPRLTGVIGDPIRLGPIGDTEVAEVIRRRIEVFRMRPEAQAPVEPDGFDHLYRVSNKNLRNSLKHAQDFSIWLADTGGLYESPASRFTLLKAWLEEQAEQYANDTRSITPRAWRLFDTLVDRGGSCSPSDYEDFGFNSQQAMRPSVKQLEDANLVDSTIDDTDSRRRTVLITSNGWLVNYKRSGFIFPPATPM